MDIEVIDRVHNKKSEFQQWIAFQLGTDNFSFLPLKGDASFRSYYRVTVEAQSYIVMLAPPTKERTDAFVNIARAWKEKGLLVPTIYGWEPTQGFVMLSDFGDTLLSDVLTNDTVDSLYINAMNTLHGVQDSTLSLPVFDEAHVRGELQLFQEWFLEKLLGITLQPSHTQLLEQVISTLVRNITTQPQVTIHRDFHSRNLMVLNAKSDLGVIDFQDAMKGPITYDLVSLLKDCYIDWPSEKIHEWIKYFLSSLMIEKNISIEYPVFSTWFDWTGLQRHLKVLGIFSRLKLRDNKPNYLADMPRIMNYILQVTRLYPEFTEFDEWLRTNVMQPLVKIWQNQNISLTRVA